MTIILQGGLLMIPILAGSVIGLGLVLERLLALRQGKLLSASLTQTVQSAIAEGDLAGAMSACTATPGAQSRIYQAALQVWGRGSARVKERVEEVGRREALGLERGLETLGMVASIEPLLGLLGTVIGMIRVFQQVVSKGVGDPAVLAEGIWVALITTAAGLCVAIPAYIAWKMLSARAQALVLDLEEEASALLGLYPGPDAEGHASEPRAES